MKHEDLEAIVDQSLDKIECMQNAVEMYQRSKYVVYQIQHNKQSKGLNSVCLDYSYQQVNRLG